MYYKNTEGNHILCFGITRELSENDIEITEQEYYHLKKNMDVMIDYAKNIVLQIQNKVVTMESVTNELRPLVTEMINLSNQTES